MFAAIIGMVLLLMNPFMTYQSGSNWQYTGEITGTTWTAVKTGESGMFLVVTYCKVQNSDAAVSTDVHIYDDDDGDADSSNLIDHGYAALAGGGWSSGNGQGALFGTETAGNGIYVVCETDSSETKVTMRGYRTNRKPIAP
jgi:hypothetical protein